MKKLFLLTRVLLKNGVGSKQQDDSGKKKSIQSKIPSVLLYIILGICFIPIIISMFVLGYSMFLVLKPYSMQNIIPEMACSIGMIFTFVFGITMIISVFYYTSDIETLLALPFKPREIVGAKFIVTWVYECVTVFMLIFPVLLGYAVAAEAGVSFYIMIVLSVILLPVIPLVYSGIISMIIMRVFKRAKNRDILTMATSAIAIIFVLGINMGTGSVAGMSEAQMADAASSMGSSMSDIMHKICPPLMFVQKALAYTDWIMMAAFIVSIIVFVLLFMLIADKIYLKGAANMAETTSKREKISASEGRKIIRRESKFKSYIRKELLIVFRTPVYFMNCVMLQIIWPLFLVVAFWGIVDGTDIQTMLTDIHNEAAAGNLMGICIAVSFILSGIVCAMGCISCTAISREGKSYAYMKYIPMSYKTQINAKVMAGVIMSVITTAGYGLIIMLVLGIDAVTIIFSVIVSIITCFIFNYLSVIMDLFRPKLNWENENSIKNNFNIVIALFGEIILCIVFAVLGALIYAVLSMLSQLFAAAAVIILLAGIAAGVYFAVTALGDYRLKRLE